MTNTTYKVRKIHGKGQDFCPTEKIQAETYLAAVREYCKIHNFGSPTELYIEVDDTFTAIDSSANGNVIGKFIVSN